MTASATEAPIQEAAEAVIRSPYTGRECSPVYYNKSVRKVPGPTWLPTPNATLPKISLSGRIGLNL